MPQGKTRLPAAARRRVILDAAAAVFARDGYHAASVLEVATGAGVTKAVLYDHFRSKEDLFLELTRSARDQLIERGAAVMASGQPLEKRMRAAVDAFFVFVQESPAYARVLLGPPKGTANMQDELSAIQAEATSRLAQLLIAETGLLAGDPRREARLILVTEFLKTGMHGLAAWWERHPETPRHALTDTMMEVSWQGIASHVAPIS